MIFNQSEFDEWPKISLVKKPQLHHNRCYRWSNLIGDIMGNLAQLTDENFQQTIAKGLTLVDFYATWCGPCRMVAPIIEQLAEKVEGKATIAKLDIDQAQQTTSAMQITSVPTLILFKDGKELKRVGVKDLDYLLNLIHSYS